MHLGRPLAVGQRIDDGSGDSMKYSECFVPVRAYSSRVMSQFNLLTLFKAKVNNLE